jgi:hypothetical protein
MCRWENAMFQLTAGPTQKQRVSGWPAILSSYQNSSNHDSNSSALLVGVIHGPVHLYSTTIIVLNIPSSTRSLVEPACATTGTWDGDGGTCLSQQHRRVLGVSFRKHYLRGHGQSTIRYLAKQIICLPSSSLFSGSSERA